MKIYHTQKAAAKELAEHLRKLSSGAVQPKEPGNGLCFEIRRFELCSGSLGNEVIDEMPHWPAGTGGDCHPVPHPDQASYYSVENKWAADEYGDNRRELCAWLAEQLEAAL